MNKIIVKILAVIIALVAGVLIYYLLMAPLVLTEAKRVAPFYVMFAFASGIGGGTWVYKRVCAWLLKKKDVENVIESSTIESASKSGDREEEITESESINL